MTYLGSPPASQAFAPGTDTFNGDGTTVAFTLSRNVATVNDIQVVVNNVVQQPTAYTVSTSTLTFTAAPSSGTANIYVRYLSTNLQSIAPQQGSVYPSSLSTPNALYWDTSSNVGIGTTAPTAPLSVVSNSSAACLRVIGRSSDQIGTIEFTNNAQSSAQAYIQSGASYLMFAANGSERMRIDSSGNVGIGTSSPAATLNVNGPTQFAGTGGAFPSSGTGIEIVGASSGNPNYIQAYNRTASTWQDLIINANVIAFGTAGSERMRLDSSGNLLINTTSMPSGYSKLAFRCNGDGSTWQNLGATGGSAPTTLAFLNSSGTRVGYIAQSGTATAFTSTSDYRLKEDVQPMVGALDKVAQLRPVTYKWKSTGGDGQGFIAHELQAVVPDCVNGEKDAVDADGNPNYQGVDTSFLVATLTAAIQEQQAMIEELKTKVAALEAK